MAYTTIDDPTLYFNTKLYTGNGTTNHSITGVGFQPDLVWIKSRDDAYNHFWFDAVRGAGKQIYSNTTGAEFTNMNNLYSFDSDGFSLAQSGNDDVTNKNNSDFVSWNWLGANASSSNTDGSITSSVSANTTAGFSIVSYTGNGTAGATVGHGLGTTPAMFWIKRRDVADGWIVYHHKNTSAPETDHLRLDNNSATSDDNTKFNDTAPTNSVFSLGSDTSVNGSSSTFIAYCFAEKKGFSSFGSYQGSGNSDGPMIWCGFKPAYLMVKGTATNTEWVILDNKREPSNDGTLKSVWANLSNAESAGYALDLLSSGFKVRNTSGSFNTSGGIYTYMAFAESPFTSSTGIPTTAR